MPRMAVESINIMVGITEPFLPFCSRLFILKTIKNPALPDGVFQRSDLSYAADLFERLHIFMVSASLINSS